MKIHILAKLAGLTLGAMASLSAQDSPSPTPGLSARTAGDRARIDRGPGGKNRFCGGGRAVLHKRKDHRRQRHDRDAGVHRWTPAYQYRAQREGADAGAAGSRLHHRALGRRSGGGKYHAPGSHRQGRDQWTAHHSIRLVKAANNTPEMARAEVRKMAEMGIKFTGEMPSRPFQDRRDKELEILRAVVDEAKKVGVMVQVHAVSSSAMVAAVDAGVPLLVHLPNKDWVSKEDAKKVAAAGVKVLGTVSFGSPVFGVFAEDNKPRFRDGKPWPEGIVNGVRLGEEAGYMPVNARTIWDAGVTLGYCTDTTYDPKAGLDHELKMLNVMFSMRDLIKMMGPNTASYIQMGDQLGTLEAGKLADLILLDGDPLEGYWNWLKTKVVVKGGVIVVDKRN